LTVNTEALSSIKSYIEAKSGKTKILAVTKNRSVDDIAKLLLLDQKLFGENKVQEAAQKFNKIQKENFQNFELHLIGPLQSNKAKLALETFDVIQTIDRIKIIDVITNLTASNRSFQTKKYFIQVNVGEESQKSGVIPSAVGDLYSYALEKNLNVIGLMCIPPNHEAPNKYFQLMNNLREEINKNLQLSMGMSSDYETAISYNSNLVRIGSKLFS
jgi:pyridoxal phosphate enzyme (YggS family)